MELSGAWPETGPAQMAGGGDGMGLVSLLHRNQTLGLRLRASAEKSDHFVSSADEDD